MKRTCSRGRRWTAPFVALSLSILSSAATQAAESADVKRGRALFRACVACHTLVSGRHTTGPSLDKIWGKKAGTVKGFRRYSRALKQAGITWDEDSLDKFLKNPRAFVPKTEMTFRGMANKDQRRDLISFLRQVSEGRVAASSTGSKKPRRGMMGGGRMANLKKLGPDNRVASIAYCDKTYTVAPESGEPRKYWEFNLRFKTDASDLGPVAKQPVIIPVGMRGDRAAVIFASPDEMNTFIKQEC